jgi:hypothetical protein
MRRFALLLSLVFLLSLCLIALPTDVSAVGTHSASIITTIPALPAGGWYYVNATIPENTAVTVTFHAVGNSMYTIGYKDPYNAQTIVKNDIRITGPAGIGYGTGGGWANASFITNATGGLGWRFFAHNIGWWTGGSACYVTISYASLNSGQVCRLVNVQTTIPYLYELYYANDTYHGAYYVGAGSSLDGLQYSIFLPNLGGVNWRSNVSYYDGTTLLHQYQYPQYTVSGYGQMTVGVYANPAATWLTQSGVITASNHIYYFNVDVMGYNRSTGALAGQYHVTLTIREPAPITAQVNWVTGIMWIAIIFIPGWLIDFVFPRYGLMLGVLLMAIVLGFTQANAIWVSFISFLVVGSMLFTMRSD